MSQPPFAIGLTGGIGSGKSTVADLFAARGATIVDTDLIAHSMTAPNGPAMPAIVAEFGPEFADASGAMDRARMRALVFSDAGAKARLEAILHPRIRDAALAAGAAGTRNRSGWRAARRSPSRRSPDGASAAACR